MSVAVAYFLGQFWQQDFFSFLETLLFWYQNWKHLYKLLVTLLLEPVKALHVISTACQIKTYLLILISKKWYLVFTFFGNAYEHQFAV